MDRITFKNVFMLSRCTKINIFILIHKIIFPRKRLRLSQGMLLSKALDISVEKLV